MPTSIFLFLALLISSTSFAAPGQRVKKGEDYSNCNPQGYGTMGIPYRIGEKGKEAGHLVPSGLYKPSVSVSTQEGGKVEKFSYEDQFELTGGKSTVIMNRENGRPVSVETRYDPKSKMAKGFPNPAGGKDVPGVLAQGIRFGYEGDKCQVSQSYLKTSDGKETVHYDAKLCKDLLGLAKKSTMKKLVECKATFAQMGEAIRKAKAEYKKTGKELMMIGMGAPGFNPLTISEGNLDQDYVAISSIGMCNLNRSIYGLPVDPASSDWGNAFAGSFAGGSPMGMGAGFGADSTEKAGDASGADSGEKGAQ
jgi:hypothetical protein